MTFAMIGPVLGGRGCYFRLMQTVHPVHDCGHYIPQDWILDFFSTLSFGQCGGTTRNGGTLCILNFLATYLQAIENRFIFDDRYHIIKNKSIIFDDYT